jgi:hypothetical protein
VKVFLVCGKYYELDPCFVARMGEGRVVHRVLVGKPEGTRSFGRPRRRWEDNIKVDLQEVGGGCGGLDGAGQYSSHYLGTWCIQHYYRWCAHLGCQQSTELTPHADLNGLVRFAERRNWFLRMCHHISAGLYPLYRRQGGPQGRSWPLRLNLAPPPTGIRSPDRPSLSESPDGRRWSACWLRHYGLRYKRRNSGERDATVVWASWRRR